MLAVDQNRHVWVWQLRKINQHKVIIVNYGGAYWLNCWTRLSQSQLKKLRGNIAPTYASRRNDRTRRMDTLRKKDWSTQIGICHGIRKLYDVLTDRAGSKESEDDDPEDNQGLTRGCEIDQGDGRSVNVFGCTLILYHSIHSCQH